MAKRVSKKANERRVEAAFYKTCNRVQFNIMDLSKIHAVGMEAVAAGASEEQLEEKLRAVAAVLRVKGA